MSKAKINLLLAFAPIVFVALGCGSLKNIGQKESAGNSVVSNVSNVSTPNAKASPTVSDANDGEDEASTSGAERAKPAAGKGNVQGKVLYNDQPVEGIEVKICEEFNTFMGVKCEGKTSQTKTDKDGVYVLADLEPKTYGGLTAKVFKSDYFVYPQEGIMTPQKFAVVADKTIFARDINLFKDDIKITNPKAGSKVDAKNIELKWDAYPDAAYYKINLYTEGGGLPPLSDERVDDPNYTVTENIANGKYTFKVVAYNAHDHKLAESSDDIKFTVTGGAEPEPKQ